MDSVWGDRAKNHLRLIPTCVAILALVLAGVGHLPGHNYTALRWVVCISAVWIGYDALRLGRFWVTWIFIPVAILFNPIPGIQASLGRTVWKPIDFITAGLFLVYALTVYVGQKKAEATAAPPPRPSFTPPPPPNAPGA